jgi:agmatine deiminase
MPAEWEPHEATWLAWPHNPEDWPGKFQPIPWVYAEIVRLLAARERVHMISSNDAKAEQRAHRASGARRRESRSSELSRWPTDRGWTRDSGPDFCAQRRRPQSPSPTGASTPGPSTPTGISTTNSRPRGGTARAARVAAFIEFQNGTKRPLVLEGGSIDVNGAGILLTTEECLLSEVQQRNPGVSREQLEQAFHDYLGIDQVIWLNRGIAGDDTHGHVDDIRASSARTTIVTAVEPTRSDPNHEPLAENLEAAEGRAHARRQAVHVVELPMPRPVVFRGQRLPASYANFYIANGLVLVPTFHDPNDRVALNILAEFFPAAKSSASTASTWSGAWARCTA